jgi:CheY-like chemotaxis protein
LKDTNAPLTRLDRILVVDDEQNVRRLLAKWLKSAGFQVSEAASGKEAVEIAAQSAPALIIMDIQLGDMTGFLATERIRALPGFRTIPVICITGLDMRVDVAHEGGCTDLLLKPLDHETFLTSVRRHLKKLTR